MGAFDMLAIAGSGLGMHQTWLDTVSYNIANLNTARRTSESAFQAQYTMAQSEPGAGVRVTGLALGDPTGRVVNDPDNPLADAEGNVRMPDIDLGSQMSQLILAQRGYQAQTAVVKNAQDLYSSALSIGKQS